MKKQVLAILAGALLTGCASLNYPLEDAGDGVYYAESPPDYVYVNTGLSFGSYYPWIGPPYLYPMTFHSPYHYLGNRWYYPPFGTPDYWAMSPSLRLAPPLYVRSTGPVYGPSHARKGDYGAYGRKSADGRYITGYGPQQRVKAQGVGRPAPAFRPAGVKPPRAAVAAPSSRASAPPRSRPSRAMRAAPAPHPKMQNSRRKIN